MQKDSERQTSQGPQDLRNNVVVRSMDFSFTLYIQNSQLKKSVTQRYQLVQTKKPQRKPAFSGQRTNKVQLRKTESTRTISLCSKDHTNTHPIPAKGQGSLMLTFSRLEKSIPTSSLQLRVV